MIKKNDSKKKRKAANYDYTVSKRVGNYRNNMREMGFKLKQFFVHPDDWDEVKKILEEKRDMRRKLLETQALNNKNNSKLK